MSSINNTFTTTLTFDDFRCKPAKESNKWGDSEWPGACDDWEDLVGSDIEIDFPEKETVIDPTVPTEKPTSPVQCLIEATMEITVTEITMKGPPPPSLRDIMEQEAKSCSPKQQSPRQGGPKGKRGKARRVDLSVFLEEEAKKEAEEAKAAAKRARKREARRRRKDRGFTEVKKERFEFANVTKPHAKQIRENQKLVTPAKGKFVNTTLILKNLPYKGVTTRDLRRFFENEAGRTKFVNILTKDNGECKGIAFIRFENRQGADKGLLMNRFTYEGRTVYVEYARDKRE